MDCHAVLSLNPFFIRSGSVHWYDDETMEDDPS